MLLRLHAQDSDAYAGQRPHCDVRHNMLRSGSGSGSVHYIALRSTAATTTTTSTMDKARCGIAVTTYEGEGGQKVPIITHVFWGDTPRQALDYARSHLVTDYFFASSLEGAMPWGGDELALSNEYEAVGDGDDDGDDDGGDGCPGLSERFFRGLEDRLRADAPAGVQGHVRQLLVRVRGRDAG